MGEAPKKCPQRHKGDLSKRLGNTSRNQEINDNRLSIVDMLEEETL